MVPRRQLTIAARVVVLVAIAAAAVATLANCSSGDKSPAPSIATVERASFSTGIASTGSLTPLAEQNLGFAKGGELTSVLVKVGDHVEAGETLATVDPVPARQALAEQTAQLRSQEAALEKLKDSPNVDGAKDSLSQAKDVREAVEDQVKAQEESDEAAIRSARQQVAIDQQSADNAKNAQDSACGSASSPSCMAAQSAYLSAQQRLTSSQSTLRAAEQKRDTDHASGQVSIETAQQSVVTARNSVDLSRSDRPHAIDQQEALVDAAKAAVTEARHDLNNTTLRAPAAGTVTALNGAVGEYVAASTGTSALAPGSDAALPGVSGATSGGTSTSTLGASGPARPGGTQFLVLSDIDQFQVVASFNETDAANLTPDETVQVTFDAIPDLTTTGRVLSVAPSGTAVSGVISYYVTVAIEADDPRLKGGQTANVTVATSERSNVLTVPSSAVRRINGHSEVTVAEGDKLRKVTFEAGAVGAERTEVVSGLREGQRVVLPVRQQGGQK
jgi:HlyD family secretion protein